MLPPTLKRRSLILAAVGLVIGGAFALGYHASAGDRVATPVAASAVDQVRSALAERYYRPVPESVLRLDSVRQIISALDDPYTAYLGPQAYKLVRQQTATSYNGIGVGLLPTPQGFRVVSLRDGPALRAGLHVDDVITRIGGVAAADLDLSSAMAHILGRPGTLVQLQLARGSQRIDVDVKRERIDAPAVKARLISFAGRRWGDVQLTSFSVGVSVVLHRQIVALERQHVAGLVLDLRENRGGLLSQAVGVTSNFIDHGVVVSLFGAHQPHQVLHAVPGLATKLPLVVLVDGYTASSAEIVAGALRDNDRATLAGQRTYGKALVQQVDPLDNGAALELTIARYLTPSGQDISGVGIRPEVHAVDNPKTRRDEALALALRVLARPTS
jgi:carboxyl-terminal processing protease